MREREPAAINFRAAASASEEIAKARAERRGRERLGRSYVAKAAARKCLPSRSALQKRARCDRRCAWDLAVVQRGRAPAGLGSALPLPLRLLARLPEARSGDVEPLRRELPGAALPAHLSSRFSVSRTFDTRCVSILRSFQLRGERPLGESCSATHLPKNIGFSTLGQGGLVHAWTRWACPRLDKVGLSTLGLRVCALRMTAKIKQMWKTRVGGPPIVSLTRFSSWHQSEKTRKT